MKQKSFVSFVRKIVGGGKSLHTGRGCYECEIGEYGVIDKKLVDRVADKLRAIGALDSVEKFVFGGNKVGFRVTGSEKMFDSYRQAVFVVGAGEYGVVMMFDFADK